MSAFPVELPALLARCRQADTSPQERGRALEDLIAAAFAAIPGVSVRARNATSVFENEELDLVMTNRGVETGLTVPGSYFSVECKNWARPVGAVEVSWFATKLRRSSQSFGVLVAANGVTGRGRTRTAAHFEAAAALGEGQAVVVLTLKELEWLGSGEQLADLLVEKHAHLVARRELYLREAPTPADLAARAPAHSERAKIQARLQLLAAEVDASADQVRSVATTLEHYRLALAEFLSSESDEPTLSGSDDAAFLRWTERNMIAFEQLEGAVERLSRACIARLRQQRTREWPVELLAQGIGERVPRHLWEPPDSPLSASQLDHWAEQLESTATYQHSAPILSILGWAMHTLLAMETDGWPPPWV